MVQRRTLLRAGLVSGLMLAGLPTRACEFFSANLRVKHPWTRATPEGADSCVVCMVFDEVQQDDRLIGIETAIAAGAEMVGAGARPGAIDFPIPRGQVSALSEAGTHIRLVGLALPMEAARVYPIQLVFERGGALRADLSVDYARFL